MQGYLFNALPIWFLVIFVVKVLVVYDTKYGNTKLVAETIVEGLDEADGIETSIWDIESLKFDDIPDFDVVLIGSPNHIGGPVRGINGFIDRLGELDIKGKKAARAFLILIWEAISTRPY
jgi:flavodoxin